MLRVGIKWRGNKISEPIYRKEQWSDLRLQRCRTRSQDPLERSSMNRNRHLFSVGVGGASPEGPPAAVADGDGAPSIPDPTRWAVPEIDPVPAVQCPVLPMPIRRARPTKIQKIKMTRVSKPYGC